jgi:hypothetical protein
MLVLGIFTRNILFVFYYVYSSICSLKELCMYICACGFRDLGILWNWCLVMHLFYFLLIMYLGLFRYPYVTGSSVVALKFKDGILMAADMGG